MWDIWKKDNNQKGLKHNKSEVQDFLDEKNL